MFIVHQSRTLGTRAALFCLLFLLGIVALGAKAVDASAATAASGCGAQEEDTVPIPVSVCAPLTRANAALTAAVAQVHKHQFLKARGSLGKVRTNLSRAHEAASSLIGAPPTDPESDDPPGPVSVIAVLGLEHRVTMKIVPLFDGMRSYRILQAFRYTLRVTHTKRDRMLDAVIALDPEGAGADYADSMADTLPSYTTEVKLLTTARDRYRLTSYGRAGLTQVLTRVQATKAKVDAAFGGGE